MVQRIDAIYEHGAFRPLQAVQGVSESTRVTLTVETDRPNGRSLAKISGILPDDAAREIASVIESEFEQVDPREW